MTKTYTISEATMDRILCALARSSDELGRAAIVIKHEAEGERPNGRTNTTLRNMSVAWFTAASAAKSIERDACNEARISIGLPAIDWASR